MKKAPELAKAKAKAVADSDQSRRVASQTKPTLPTDTTTTMTKAATQTTTTEISAKKAVAAPVNKKKGGPGGPGGPRSGGGGRKPGGGIGTGQSSSHVAIHPMLGNSENSKNGDNDTNSFNERTNGTPSTTATADLCSIIPRVSTPNPHLTSLDGSLATCISTLSLSSPPTILSSTTTTTTTTTTSSSSSSTTKTFTASDNITLNSHPTIITVITTVPTNTTRTSLSSSRMGPLEAACPVEVILPKMTPLHASHLIRKKSSLAAKLRKVFVAKVPSSTLKDIQDDELSPLPHKHSSQSLMSPSSPLAPYTLEDIITNAQDEDLGSLGLMSDYGLLLAMGLPQLEQPETEHRGSVSSTSSCDISSPTESKEDLETTPLTTPEISPLSSPHLKESALPAEHPLSCAPPSPSPSPSPSQMAPSIGVAPSQHPLSSPFSALPPLPPPPPLPLLSDADLPISSEPATPTRAVKKRLSFATITSFFNPRHEEQETIKKKQQRSSSVPNVEHPLTAVGRQLAGFQRRHSLNDMHPNAPPAHVKSSSVPSSPPPFIAPPWDKDLLSAQAAHAAAEFMDENKTPTHAPSKLKGVFGKRNKKKKNAVVAGMVPTTPVTNPSNHVLATGKPLRPALVVRRAHRAPSIRSVKRAPSIRAPSIRHVHHRSSSHSQDTLGHSRKISTEHGGQGRTSLERSSTIVRHHRENTMGPGRVPKRSSSARISTSFSSPRSSEDYDLGATLAALRASPSTPRVLPIITKCSPPINPLATLSPTSSYGSLSSGSDSASESASSTSTVDPGVSTPNKRLSIHSDIPRRHSVDQAMPGMGQFLGSPGFSTAYSTPSSNASSSMYFSGTSSPTVSSPHGNGPKMFSFPPQQQQPMPQYRNFHNHHPMPDHYQYNVHQQMMTSPPPPSQPHQQFNQAYPSPSHYQFHQFAGLQQQQQHQQGQYTYTYPPQAPLPLLHFHHPLQPAPEYYHPMPHRMGPPPPPQGMRPFHFPAPQYPGMAVGGGYPVAPIPHHPSSPGPARAISRPVTPSRMMSVSESQGQGGKAGGRTVEFSAQSSVHQTWAADQYDRSSDPHITAQRLTPAIAHKIKLELNQFKSQEMVVHHESRLNTHFFV